MLLSFNYFVIILLLQPLIYFFSFGKMFGGSKDAEIFQQWSKNVTDIISEGNEIIEHFKLLLDKPSASLEEYRILLSRFEALNAKKYAGQTFSLKGKDKEDFERQLDDLNLFLDDYDFFVHEIQSKKENFERIEKLNKDLDSYMTTLGEIESKQQLLARTIPRINTNAELAMVEEELAELRKILPENVESDPGLPEDLQIRIERTNIKLTEWTKKLDFIQNSINKYRGKIESSVQEQEQKQNLSKIHTWLDSSETRIMKMSDKIKKISELINDESSSSKDLVNSVKELDKLKSEIQDIKPPEIDLIGEKQTKIGIDFRLKELNRLETSIHEVERAINNNITYRIAFIRSSILEKMFLKSHQLSYSQVNYSLGYKNELLLKGWLASPAAEKFNLKNHQNKYLMLSKENISSLKESSEKLFESLKALTDFERETNEISYNQSIKWLLSNDAKWLEK